jgi:hypothetical protein
MSKIDRSAPPQREEKAEAGQKLPKTSEGRPLSGKPTDPRKPKSERTRAKPPEGEKGPASKAAGAERWGNLPSVIRDHLDAVMNGPFMARYRVAIEAYFKRLSDAESSASAAGSNR